MAVLLNVDLAVEVSAHLLNDLAALADDVLDLISFTNSIPYMAKL